MDLNAIALSERCRGIEFRDLGAIGDILSDNT